MITEEVSDETTVSTAAVSTETAKNTTTTTESKAVDTEKEQKNIEETGSAVTTSKTTTASVEAGENTTTTVMTEEAVAEEITTLPPVTTEEQVDIEEVSTEDTEAVSEIMAESNGTFQWEILITPEGFPKLADSVSAYYFYSSSGGCELIWDSLSEDKDNEYFDKIAKWLGEYEYSGKMTPHDTTAGLKARIMKCC